MAFLHKPVLLFLFFRSLLIVLRGNEDKDLKLLCFSVLQNTVCALNVGLFQESSEVPINAVVRVVAQCAVWTLPARLHMN